MEHTCDNKGLCTNARLLEIAEERLEAKERDLQFLQAQLDTLAHGYTKCRERLEQLMNEEEHVCDPMDL